VDNDIFEGLPVKQWSATPSRISLAPPPSETDIEKALDKWADPAMPESSHLLLPHTQQLLRIARSGKYGTKRKTAPDAEPDGDDFNAREEEGVPDEALAKPVHIEEKGFVARKWRQVPEAALVPEHLHWEFLAKRRKGLPSYYHGATTDISASGMPQIARRKTRVQRVLDVATGESVIYEVLALEGQVLENELPADSQMQATHLEPGTTVEGLGTAGEDGLISLVPSGTTAPSRRNRPPPKKKGGPGRGKKRVTFTNPDGSTYTTIVPNATKIVPQPGQTVKHVAKGEDAGKDVSMEEAARLTNEAEDGGDQDEEGDDDEEGDEGDDDDEDREDGEIQEDDVEAIATPAKKATTIEASTVETHPTASAPATHAPDLPTSLDIIRSDKFRDTQLVDEPKLDLDVEMEDRPADVEAEVKDLLEPIVQTEALPVSQSGPDDVLLEARVHSPPKPELHEEAPQVADAMDLEPVAELTASTAASPPIAPAQTIVSEAEPVAPEVEVEKPDPTLESEKVLRRADPEPQPVEQVLEVEVEFPADVPVISEAPKEPEAPADSEVVAHVEEVVTSHETDSAQEPPLETFDDGEEDLLGSLERSLES
jgi:hypothetical protein